MELPRSSHRSSTKGSCDGRSPAIMRYQSNGPQNEVAKSMYMRFSQEKQNKSVTKKVSEQDPPAPSKIEPTKKDATPSIFAKRPKVPSKSRQNYGEE